MPSTALRDSANIEYSVYTFQKSGGASGDRWKKHDSFFDMSRAVAQAETLFATRDYCRVEIKQKYTDPKTRQCVDMTLKTYGRNCPRGRGSRWALVAAVAGAVIGGLVVMAAVYGLFIR